MCSKLEIRNAMNCIVIWKIWKISKTNFSFVTLIAFCFLRLRPKGWLAEG